MIIMRKRTGLIAALIVVLGIALTISLTQAMINLFADYLNRAWTFRYQNVKRF